MKDKIKNTIEHQEVLKRIYELIQMELQIDSPEYKELEVLSNIVEQYENHNFPVISPQTSV